MALSVLASFGLMVAPSETRAGMFSRSASEKCLELLPALVSKPNLWEFVDEPNPRLMLLKAQEESDYVFNRASPNVLPLSLGHRYSDIVNYIASHPDGWVLKDSYGHRKSVTAEEAVDLLPRLVDRKASLGGPGIENLRQFGINLGKLWMWRKVGNHFVRMDTEKHVYITDSDPSVVKPLSGSFPEVRRVTDPDLAAHYIKYLQQAYLEEGVKVEPNPLGSGHLLDISDRRSHDKDAWHKWAMLDNFFSSLMEKIGASRRTDPDKDWTVTLKVPDAEALTANVRTQLGIQNGLELVETSITDPKDQRDISALHFSQRKLAVVGFPTVDKFAALLLPKEAVEIYRAPVEALLSVAHQPKVPLEIKQRAKDLASDLTSDFNYRTKILADALSEGNLADSTWNNRLDHVRDYFEWDQRHLDAAKALSKELTDAGFAFNAKELLPPTVPPNWFSNFYQKIIELNAEKRIHRLSHQIDGKTYYTIDLLDSNSGEYEGKSRRYGPGVKVQRADQNYLTAHELHVRSDGKVYVGTNPSQLLHTSEARTALAPGFGYYTGGWALLVIDQDGKPYVIPDKKVGQIQHSTITDKPIFMGRIKVNFGKIDALDDRSGHSIPPLRISRQGPERLNQLGADLTETKIQFLTVPGLYDDESVGFFQ